MAPILGLQCGRVGLQLSYGALCRMAGLDKRACVASFVRLRYSSEQIQLGELQFWGSQVEKQKGEQEKVGTGGGT